MNTLTYIDVRHDNNVVYAHLDRPQKANALNHELWFEIEALANWVNETPSVRVLVLSGNGRHFCAGIDFELIQQLHSEYNTLSEGNRQERLYNRIRGLQGAFSALEKCVKPVIAAINGLCIGAGVDLITACDMRYCIESAVFSIKEIDLAIVADIGTIQRLPLIVGQGQARELTYTGREFDSEEAARIGLVNRVFKDKESLDREVSIIAENIASKSPLAVRNTKKTFNYSRDHSVEEGLQYVATLNAGILFSSDTTEALSAFMQKRSPTFSD